MFFVDLIEKIKGKNNRLKEDLYIQVLLWAHGKQETGFTHKELNDYFNLNDLQKAWVMKIFFTTSDSDRKFFEILRNEDKVVSNVYYYSLNEKGISAAINYKGLEHAEKNSELALWVAIISIILTAVGLFLQFFRC